MKKLLLLALLVCPAVFAQREVDLGKSITVVPFPMKEFIPGGCRPGQVYTDLRGVWGQNVYICDTGNTWHALAAGSNGGPGTITGGTCIGQVVTAIDGTGVPTCQSVSNLFTDNTVVVTTGSYTNPSWLISIPYTKVTGLGSSGPITYSGGLFGCAVATGSVDGCISADDWARFNAKQQALGFTPLSTAQNLADLTNLSTARSNLGLGTASLLAATAFDASGQAATAQATAINLSAQRASNLSDLANAAAARTNLGLGTISTKGATTGANIQKADNVGGLTPAFAADVISLFSTCSGTQYLGADGTCHTVTGGGTLSSVDMIPPSWLTVSGAPVTGSGGTITLTASTGQTANSVLATPNGASGALSVRALVAGDIPSIAESQVTNLTTDLAGKQAALGFTPLSSTNNLSDLGSAATARTNLGLGSAAQSATTAFDAAGAASSAQTAAVALSAQRASNLSDLASAGSARSNLGLGTVATHAAPSGSAIQKADGSGGFSAALATDVVSLFSTCSGTQFLAADGTCKSAGTGTLSSVTLTVPSWLSVTGSPMTSNGTFAVTAATGQTANQFLGTPDSVTGGVSLRALVAADLPTITSVGTVTTGTWQATKIGLLYGGTNADLSASGGTHQVLRQSTAGGAVTVGQLACADLSNSGTGCSATLATVATSGDFNDLSNKPSGLVVPSSTNLLKGDGAGGIAIATPGTNYAVATNGTNNQALTSNGTGGFGTAVTLATSATTDATNASNISSGTLPAGRLPVPSATTLGGVESYAAVANQFIDRISTAGVPSSRAIGAGDVPNIAESQVTSLVSDLSGKQANLGYTPLNPANNLSELTATASTARTNLGLGTAATHATGDYDASGAAAAAQTAAIAASAQRASNLSDLASATSAKTNLGLVAVASSGSASDLSTGTLAAARGGAGTITGALKANGSGLVSQAACADLSNGSASCSTDTTNAGNISTGTLPAGRLPNPSATTLGGVQSYAAVANQFIDRISTAGVPSSRAIATGDVPTLNQNTTGTAAALAANGTNCSAGNYPLGVDASGNAETCTVVPDGTKGAYSTVTFSATPAFTVTSNTAHGFTLTLTGNVTSSTISGATAGQIVGFSICQDSTGGRTLVWPATFVNPGTINGTASACTQQAFQYDGTNYQARSAAYITNGTGTAFTMAGTTSGSTVIQPSATASGTITFPAATDTLVGKATTDTLTNKTFDTAGTGNSFSINGVAATANQGTGSVVRATSPTLTTPVLGAATATSINKMAITAPATSSTLAVGDGKTLTASNTLTFTGTDGSSVAFGAGGTNAYTNSAISGFTGTITASQSPAFTGDVSKVSGSLATTVLAVNGTTVPTNSAADQTLVTTASAVAAWTSLPNCTDTSGNHINYTVSTHLFSCGTSGGSSSGGGTPYAADTGTANNVVITPSPAVTLTAGSSVFFKAAANSTGNVTFTPNGLTQKNLMTATAATLPSGALTAGTIYLAVYDGTQWELTGTGNCVMTSTGMSCAVASSSSLVMGGSTSGSNTYVGPAVAGGATLRLAGYSSTADPTSGNCVQWASISGNLVAGDSGTPCSTSSAKTYPVAFGSTTALTCSVAGITSFIGTTTSSTTETSVIRFVAPEAYTISRLYVKNQGAVPTSETMAITVMVNAVAQTPTCSIAAAGTTCNDTAHSVTVAAGDLVDIRSICTGATTSSTGPIQISLGVK